MVVGLGEVTSSHERVGGGISSEGRDCLGKRKLLDLFRGISFHNKCLCLEVWLVMLYVGLESVNGTLH